MPSATTTTIQNSINWSAAFVVQRPTTGVAQITGEPAITTANVIMQSIMGPPLTWPWNRTNAVAAFQTTQGISDYTINLPTFGYLEKAVLVNPAAQGQEPPNQELEVYRVLGKDGKQNRPLNIAILLEDANQNYTFRLFPVPDKIYTVDLTYQNQPIFIPQGANLATTLWAPIPDKLSYLYQRGFLAQLQGMYNSQLYMAGMELFFRQLVAANEGLTEAEKAIFLEDKLRQLQTQAAALQTVQQGKQARG